FDILLTDLMMPEVDGIQLLNDSKRRYPESVVIIMTGYASLDSAIQAIRGGAYDYIRKPFKIEELEIVIQNASEKILLQRENRHLIKKLEEMIESTRRLKQIWEGYWMEMVEVCRAISSNETNFDVELILKQIYPIPPDYDPQISHRWEKSAKVFERLLQMKKDGLLNDEQFNSFLKIFSEKFLEPL
ncbi:MAG: response regulator, partial [Candidatus Methanomethylicaceae archaeon]